MAITTKKIVDQNIDQRAHKIHHPAKFTDRFLPIFAHLLKDSQNVIDPFAGTGKLALIKTHGYTGKVICNELERD